MLGFRRRRSSTIHDCGGAESRVIFCVNKSRGAQIDPQDFRSAEATKRLELAARRCCEGEHAHDRVLKVAHSSYRQYPQGCIYCTSGSQELHSKSTDTPLQCPLCIASEATPSLVCQSVRLPSPRVSPKMTLSSRKEQLKYVKKAVHPDSHPSFHLSQI